MGVSQSQWHNSKDTTSLNDLPSVQDSTNSTTEFFARQILVMLIMYRQHTWSTHNPKCLVLSKSFQNGEPVQWHRLKHNHIKSESHVECIAILFYKFLEETELETCCEPYSSCLLTTIRPQKKATTNYLMAQAGLLVPLWFLCAREESRPAFGGPDFQGPVLPRKDPWLTDTNAYCASSFCVSNQFNFIIIWHKSFPLQFGWCSYYLLN